MNVEVVKLHSDYVLSQLRTVIHWNFSNSVNYSEMEADEYHAKVARTQDAINERGLGAILAWNIRDEIARYCSSQHVMLQSGIYLRAARPGLENDVVGWHRESFYGAPAGSVNLWMPVMNVTIDNTLQYFPGTDAIPDRDIQTEQGAPQIERGSPGQKIGLLYAPKRIVGWRPPLDTIYQAVPEPMIVPDGSVALFPGSLIHGAAVNRTDRIRFSVDVRLLARENVQ